MPKREVMYDLRKDQRKFNQTANWSHWWNTMKYVPRGGGRL